MVLHTIVSIYEPPKGRMRILPGLKGSIIIDDTYNSSPAAVEAALDTFALLKKDIASRQTGVQPIQADQHSSHAGLSAGRQVAVLGDMLELGKHSVDEHRKMGALAAKRADLLVTVGIRARDIALGALEEGMSEKVILQYDNAEQAGEELQAMLSDGDCVLVKGSQSIRTEKIVQRLMLEPERAGELLVRQEADWKRR